MPKLEALRARINDSEKFISPPSLHSSSPLNSFHIFILHFIKHISSTIFLHTRLHLLSNNFTYLTPSFHHYSKFRQTSFQFSSSSTLCQHDASLSSHSVAFRSPTYFGIPFFSRYCTGWAGTWTKWANSFNLDRLVSFSSIFIREIRPDL